MPKGTILMTGATGALGSMILPRLIKAGYRVVALVRADNNEHAQNRLGKYDPKRVIAIRGDITEPRCGISDLDADLWKNEINQIFHCAASISFADKVEAERSNINGVRHTLELADLLGVLDFRHVSTTYVAGNAETFDESDLLVGQTWRNPYEHSKYVGETLVRGWAIDPHRRYMIYRPSILIGCEDGTSPTFDAYYGYFRPISSLADSMRAKEARGGNLPEDVAILRKGKVVLPLVLVANPHSTLNLIPIDWAADMMVALQEEEPSNKCFHFSHPNPPLVHRVIRWSLDALRIEGFRTVENQTKAIEAATAQSQLVARLQKRQVDPVLEQYLPYVTHGTNFQTTVTKLSLGHRYRVPVNVDRKFLRKLLAYAVETKWGTVHKDTSQLEVV